MQLTVFENMLQYKLRTLCTVHVNLYLHLIFQGEHGETGGGDIYNKPIHGGHPHAVPNPVDPNYSHLKEVWW